MSKVINRLKSKLIERLISSGQYSTLREGIYQETLCKAYCSVEVPSQVFQRVNEETVSMAMALRSVLLERVTSLREKGVINISDNQYEVFKNELLTPAKGGTLFNQIYNRFISDGGLARSLRRTTVQLRSSVMSNLSAAVNDSGVSIADFVHIAIEDKLKELGYGK